MKAPPTHAVIAEPHVPESLTSEAEHADMWASAQENDVIGSPKPGLPASPLIHSWRFTPLSSTAFAQGDGAVPPNLRMQSQPVSPVSRMMSNLMLSTRREEPFFAASAVKS